jgi:hypothetical protein
MAQAIPIDSGGLSLVRFQEEKEGTYDKAYADLLGLAVQPGGYVSYNYPSAIVGD